MRAFFASGVALALVLLLFSTAGCGGGNVPECDPEIVDLTDRPIVFCRDEGTFPICDLDGDMARFEEGVGGRPQLVGGERPYCEGEEGVVVCPTSNSEPYCLLDSEG